MLIVWNKLLTSLFVTALRRVISFFLSINDVPISNISTCPCCSIFLGDWQVYLITEKRKQRQQRCIRCVRWLLGKSNFCRYRYYILDILVKLVEGEVERVL